MPAAILSSVDLPEPLRPTSAILSPTEAVKAAPSSSGVPPKVSFIPSRLRRGGAISAFGQWIGMSEQQRAAVAECDFEAAPGLVELDLVGNGQRRAEGHLDLVQRPFGAGDGQAGKFGKTEDRKQRAVGIVEAGLSQ